MLVLARKKDQSIMLGDLIEVKVISIRGQQVRLGIKAPSEMPVHRREVFEKIQKAESNS